MVGLVVVAFTPPNAVPLNMIGMLMSNVLVSAQVNSSVAAVAAVTVNDVNEGRATLVALVPALNPTT